MNERNENMEIATPSILKTVLRFIDYRMNCPYPSGRLDLPPAAGKSASRLIGKLRKQLESSGGLEPAKVARSFRSLYRLIKQPLSQSTERLEAMITDAARDKKLPQWFADFLISWESEQIVAFEKVGADPKRRKSSKR
jgi:hypothetical protein